MSRFLDEFLDYFEAPKANAYVEELRAEIKRLQASLDDECHKNEALLGEIGRLRAVLDLIQASEVEPASVLRRIAREALNGAKA